MCMEDIKMGRRTVSSTVSRLVSNLSFFHVPANGKRVGLLMGMGDAPGFTILRELHSASLTPQLVGDNLWMTGNQTTNHIMMRIEDYGIAVQLAYTIYNQSGGDRTAQYTEFILLE